MPNLKKNVAFIKENQVKTHKEYKSILNTKETKYEKGEQRKGKTDLLQEYIKVILISSLKNIKKF